MNLKIIVALSALLAGCPSYGLADCRHFFVKQHAVAVQQVAAVPYAFYAAGQSIQEDALAAKVAALVEQRLTQSLKQQQAAPKQAVSASVFAKCASCHSAANPAGGLVLDGQTGVSCLTYFRWGQIAGQGKGVPAKMQAVISGLTPEEKGAINSALLDLVQPTPAKAAEPQEDLE